MTSSHISWLSDRLITEFLSGNLYTNRAHSFKSVQGLFTLITNTTDEARLPCA